MQEAEVICQRSPTLDGPRISLVGGGGLPGPPVFPPTSQEVWCAPRGRPGHPEAP